MTYEISINLIEILRTTLYLLEHTQYDGKASSAVENLRQCLLGTIAELESARTEGELEEQTGSD